MIYIQEHFNDSESVTVIVDGLLMGESVHTLREVLVHHLGGGKRVSVNLKKINYISREGKGLLKEFEDKGILVY